MDNIKVYEDSAGEWRFQVKGRNGEIVAAGEGYSTQAAAFRGTQALKRIVIEQVDEDRAEENQVRTTVASGGQARTLTTRADEIIAAAHCYLSAAHRGNSYDFRMVPMDWPWKRSDWKPGTKLENIEKAIELLREITEPEGDV